MVNPGPGRSLSSIHPRYHRFTLAIIGSRSVLCAWVRSKPDASCEADRRDRHMTCVTRTVIARQARR